MLLRRAILFGGAALVLLIAAVAAGWWFFMREDNQLAADAPDIPTELVQSTATPGGSPAEVPAGVVTFRIIPEQSEAAYFVGEQLASVGVPSTAKGSTTAIEGEFYVAADGASLAPEPQSQFTVDVTTLQSNEDRRDTRVQEALETTAFPTATFTISSVTGYDPSIPEGEEQTLQMTGTFELHGVQREVTWEVKARRQSNVITALATLDFTFAEYSITPPNFAGFVSVEDHGTLQVQLVAQLV